MRRITWIPAAVLALAGAGAAIAWHGNLLKTDAVTAEFSATRTSLKERTCTGTDGNTYRTANVVLAGTMTSGDSRLNGGVLFRLTIREDVKTGLGTTEGRVWIRDGGRRAAVNVIGVNKDGKINGMLNGRVHRSDWLVANFSATWDWMTLHGQLGQDSPVGPTNAAVIQSRHQVRCSRPGTTTEQSGTGKLEIRKVLSPSDDSGRFDLFIKQGGTTIDSESNEGDGGSTGERAVAPGTYEVSETAVDGTKLSDYTTSISCKDGNGTGTEIKQGGADGDLDVAVAAAADVVCMITNTRKS